MKLKNIFLGIVATAFALWGCDYVSKPLKSTSVNSSLPSGPPTFKDSSSNPGTYKILIEDCMGHTCPNCPEAVIAGDAITDSSNTLSRHVILIEDHVGGFADTVTQGAPIPDSAYHKDYRSVAGEAWRTQFQMDGPGYPFGMINRRDYSSTSPANVDINYANWQDTVQALAAKTPLASINIHDSCWVPQRIIGVELQITFKTALPGNYLLETLIVQDSIIDWQEDNLDFPPYVPNFIHRNVVRGAFGNNTGGLAFGVQIPTSASGSADGTWTTYQTYDFTKGENGKAAGYTNNPAWNMAHCYIVAYIFGAPTNTADIAPYQIIQAEMIKVE